MHPSISDISEPLLVQQLLAAPHWRSTLLGIEGIPEGARHFQAVPMAGIPGGVKSDVDILLCVPGQPDLAIAIEAKRVKIRNGPAEQTP